MTIFISKVLGHNVKTITSKLNSFIPVRYNAKSQCPLCSETATKDHENEKTAKNDAMVLIRAHIRRHT